MLGPNQHHRTDFFFHGSGREKPGFSQIVDRYATWSKARLWTLTFKVFSELGSRIARATSNSSMTSYGCQIQPALMRYVPAEFAASLEWNGPLTRVRLRRVSHLPEAISSISISSYSFGQ